MSVGYAQDPEEDPPIPGMPPGVQAAGAPGLAGFDVNAAAQNLADVGQPPPEPASAEAPTTAAPQYGTVLDPNDETSYQKWKATLPPRLQSETDYDLRGFFKENPTFSVNTPGQHMTDKFKLPNHETFSNESKYYNDQTAIRGGKWSEGPNGTSVFTPNDPARAPIIEDAQGNRLSAAPPSATGTKPPETVQPAAAGGETSPVPGATPTPPAPLGPPPAPPTLSGDPAKDVQANIEYGRKLTDWHAAATRARAESDKAVATLEAGRAGRELAAEEHANKLRQAEAAEYKRVRNTRQAAIDQAVSERMAAKNEAGKSWWETSTTGQKVGAALLFLVGDWQAGMRNAAAAQLGAVGNAQNEGLRTINGLIESDARRKKDRLAAASDSLLEARYGYKDAAENHRAAQNDIDADTAANYRLAAKQFEADLRKRGATDADLKSNEALGALYDKATQAETAIQQREEEMAGQRQKADAQNALAAQDVGLKKEQIAATREAHEGTLKEQHFAHVLQSADRADRLAAEREARKEKEAAKKAASTDKDEKEIVRDEQGNPYARVPTGRGGAQGFTTRDADYGRALEQLTALRKDVAENDAHVLKPSAVARRNTLYDSAVIGVAAVSPLGKTEEAQKLEAGSIGPSGVLDPTARNFSTRGASIEAIDRKIAEIKGQRDRYRKETLRPLEGEKSIREPAEAGPAAEMVTIKNAKTGETKQVTRDEAKRLGAL